MYIYVCIHIYSVYMLLYKKASLLVLWVNTFYSTITITTVYIPNQNALIIYQEDIGLKQSVDHDQEVCNNMLNGTAISVCECVCVCAYGCEIASRPLHTHFPHDTCTHTRRKRSVQQLVWLTLPQQLKCDPGSIFAVLQSSERLFLHLSSFCFHTNLARLPGLKPQLSELMQEWARHSFPSEAGFTHMRADFFFFIIVTWHFITV